ncbi:MAG: hypothetical protein FWG17_05625 [Desulfovibrionaceae bacterium]|nr:hypothetical protein [Desulfovibrionaceae bacterium]
MERREAAARLKALERQNLHALAAQYGITVSTPWQHFQGILRKTSFLEAIY